MVAVPLRYGSRVIGVVVSPSSASTSSTRTTSACSRCSPATRRSPSRTRASTRRSAARPTALKALLEFTGAISRRRHDPDEVAGRDGRARPRGCSAQDCALWLPDERRRLPDRGPLATTTSARLRPMLASRSTATPAAVLLGEQRALRAQRSRGDALVPLARSALGPTCALAPVAPWAAIDGVIGVRAPRQRPALERRLLACSAASPTRRRLRCSARAASRAWRDVRLDGRGARQRARGERRVHLLARALDHRHGADGRRGARPRRPSLKRARARRPLPRHRQDRRPAANPAQAGPAHGRRAADHRDSTRSSASGSSPRSTGSAEVRADRPALPRALGRRRATPTARPARRSRSRRASSSSATPSTR